MPDDKIVTEAANAIGAALEKVPVYQDVVQPAAQELGNNLLTLAKAVRVALAPVSALVWGYDRVKEYLERALLERLEHVPSEKLVTPEPAVAVPAVEALRLVGHQPSLADLFANLLATSMERDKARLAHPAYVEIIKQLSPDEAKVVRLMARQLTEEGWFTFPLLEVVVTSDTGEYFHARNLSVLPFDAGCEHPDLGPTYVENIQRLGLIALKEGELNAGRYGALEEHPALLAIREEARPAGRRSADEKVVFQRSVCMLTHFGRQFLAACVSCPAGAVRSPTLTGPGVYGG